jgi:hypothetical protein
LRSLCTRCMYVSNFLKDAKTIQESRNIALFWILEAENGWGDSVTSRPFSTPEKTWYRFYRRQVWTGAENLTHTEIRSQDRPARIQSLYQLSHLGPHTLSVRWINLYRALMDDTDKGRLKLEKNQSQYLFNQYKSQMK